MKTCYPESRCVPKGHNSPESMCDRCESEHEQAREVRNEQLRKALTAFAEQMPGRMWDYAVSNTISAIVRSINMDGKCRLCGCYGDHAPGCSVVGLKELID
jgi:hypothetical protein